MKVIFITNFVCFHQIYIWDNFYKNLSKNDQFIFLATSQIDEERKKMGYKEDERKYILKSYLVDENKLLEVFDNVDFVIVGNNDDKRINKYLWKAKYYISASEHFIKQKPLLNFLSLMRKMLTLKSHNGFNNKYLLCYSSRIGKEYSFFNFNKNNIFKFGYFPELVSKTLQNLDNKDRFMLVFSGRLLGWKRPILAIKILEEFLKINKKYNLTIIGEGPEESKIKKYIKKKHLENNVTLLGFIEHEKLLNIFSKASFCLFTSNKSEGWGVVLNEALSRGCIPIASYDAGSTTYLIENNKNGFIFKNNHDLGNIVKTCCILNKEKYLEISNNCIKTIKEKWNGQIAGERLYSLLKNILIGADSKWVDGPLSNDFN